MVYQRYTPKRPIKSFQDLEIYQLLLGSAVAIFRRTNRPGAEIDTAIGGGVPAEIATSEGNRSQKAGSNVGTGTHWQYQSSVLRGLLGKILALPKQIATAHSMRFNDMSQALQLLDKAMLNCNLAVVHLEYYRDLCNDDIEVEFFDEQIKLYLRLRFKIMHLARSWEKFSSFSRDGNPREIS